MQIEVREILADENQAGALADPACFMFTVSDAVAAPDQTSSREDPDVLLATTMLAKSRNHGPQAHLWIAHQIAQHKRGKQEGEGVFSNSGGLCGRKRFKSVAGRVVAVASLVKELNILRMRLSEGVRSRHLFSN